MYQLIKYPSINCTHKNIQLINSIKKKKLIS